jgi:hypothetical protein
LPERWSVPGPEEVRDFEEPEMGEARVREELVAISMRVFWARMMGELMVAEPVETVMEGVEEGSERVRVVDGELVRR